MKTSWHTFLLILLSLSITVFGWIGTAGAQSQQKTADSEYKSGVGNRVSGGFGGPNSVPFDLEENDRKKKPAFELPAFDRFFAPWFAWKEHLSNKGFSLGLDYATLYQGANESLTNEDKAASGIFRVFTNWALINRDSENTGSLVLKVENRQTLGTDVAPAGLANEIGYLGVTGVLFSDIDWILNDSYWSQQMFGGRGGFIAGRFDPNDFMDINGYASPWTAFQNVAVLLNGSIAFPDTSWGFGAGAWAGDQVFIQGTINDANGVVTQTDWFKGGSEFFKQVGIGWTPARDKRYSNAVTVTGWHVDERKDAGVPDDYGVAVNGNWTTEDGNWMLFGRLGASDGSAALYKKTATIGFGRLLDQRTDVLGVGLNWGDPGAEDLKEQTTLEIFYRLQFAQNLALTPSVQYLKNPALNLGRDSLWIAAIRLRVTL
jgi:porin